MAPNVPMVTLGDGKQCPQIGLGTWQAAPGEVEKAVGLAIDLGYRHLDCAMVYGNEKEIGDAIRSKIEEGAVKRSELFIVTKLWNTFHETEKVVPACKQSLQNFGLDYIDLYLVHWPIALKHIGPPNNSRPFENAVGFEYDYVNTWKGMEECHKLGLAKSIGLSNFNNQQVKRILDSCTIKPVMNQFEVHPLLHQQSWTDYCQSNGIQVTAYSPFGSPSRPWAKQGDPVGALNEPVLKDIAKAINKTPAQVVLRYITQLGCIPVPKSTNPKRLEENLNIFDFKLTDQQMGALAALECNGRAITADELKGMPHFPFEEN